MASHQEIEVKLRTDPAKIAKIRRSPWWRGLERLQRQSLHSIYYDTSDHRLRDCRISLRTRTDGHSFVQTLKMPNAASDSVARTEWETTVPDPIPDPSLVIDPALPDDFRKLTSADLQPVFDVEIKRETRRLASDGAQIDVSLDQGAVILGEAREPIHEIELELVSGDLPALFAEAQRIADLVDGRLHTRTKADIGYALGDAERRHWSRASKLSLTPEMTAEDSLRLIVFNSFSHLTANDDCARLNLHIEGVHQCRIALRRLRSAFKIYRQLLRRKRIAPIDEEVRWLGNILGAARDIDVLQTELLEPAIAALGEEKQLAPLMVTLAAKKAEAYRNVAEALASPRYRHLLIDLCALGHADDLSKSGEGRGLDQPLLGLASAALTRAHQKLLKRGHGFEGLSKAERHEVRIALKRLRYALDFFSDVFDGEQKKKFVKKLARLQDDLGRMNDVAVAETMLARLVGVSGDGEDTGAATASSGHLAFAAGGVLGWHRRRAAEMDVELVKDWKSFMRAKPFWLEPGAAE
jgi:inorganic triphosphatase YgiF